MSLNVELKLTKYYLIRLIASITFITLYGCGGGNSEVEVKEEVVIPPAAQAPITDTLDLIGLWMSNCGERNNSAYYANELVLTSENLEIIQHKYDVSDCTEPAVESISQTNKPYSYPESNNETNDKSIVVEVSQDPLWEMTVNIEIYDDLLYLSNNLSISHEGFAFDSSETNDINYVNYLTKQE